MSNTKQTTILDYNTNADVPSRRNVYNKDYLCVSVSVSHKTWV